MPIALLPAHLTVVLTDRGGGKIAPPVGIPVNAIALLLLDFILPYNAP
jgi:hypothetical protein